jgi:dipeptidyl aminopeptidase/acylaminoacyl peptidase
MKTATVTLATLIATISFAPLQGAVEMNLAPGDNLVLENIPSVPADLANVLSRYSEIRSASIASWHPSRREMLILTRFADTAQAHLVKTPGGARTQLTFFKDRITGAGYQPTHGKYFVFSSDRGGDENYQKYRYDSATGEITLLTDGKSRNTGGVWSTRGDRLVYGSTRRNGQDVDLWIMDPENPKTDRMLATLEGGGWEPLDFSPDDRQIIVSEMISANESYLWLFDADSGNRTLLTPKGESEKVFYGQAKFSKDGKGIYATTDRDSEFQRLAYIDRATKKYAYLSDAIHWDIERFDLSFDGRLIAFVANEDGMGVLHLLDTASRKEKKLPRMPAGMVSTIEWHRNNRELALGIHSARNTPDAYSLDLRTGNIERWTQSETGGLDTSGFAEPELIRWKSFDGKTISGWLHKPPQKFNGKRPVIIDIHGGPEGQSRPLFQGANNYYLDVLGIAIIHPNVRGSTGYGKSFSKLDNGFLRENSYKDIGALMDWIRTRPDLDADRIMVTGGSYGGHMTLAISTFYADRIRCAVDIVGIGNLVTFLEHTSAYRRDLRRVEYGDERDPKMREFLNHIAPLNNASKIVKPLFIVQGGNDPRVPLSEATQMVESVQKTGTPVWYLMAKDEGHGFAKKKNREFQLCATVLFIKTYLLPPE